MKHIKDEILSAYANDEIVDNEKQNIEEHLLSCTKCQKALDVYREVRKQLSIETPIYAGNEIKGFVMSNIREPKVIKANPTTNWRRRALVAIPIVAAVVISLSLILTNSPLTPEQVFAKATAASTTISAYRQVETHEINMTYPDLNDETYTMTDDIVSEFAGPGRFHTIDTVEINNLGLLLSSIKEVIGIDNNVYYNGSLPAAKNVSEYFTDEMTLIITNPQSYFSTLKDIHELPSEKINGTVCLHYKGTMDWDIHIAHLKILLSQNPEAFGQNGEKFLEFAVKLVPYEETTYELWVGKVDYLIRQIKANHNSDFPADLLQDDAPRTLTSINSTYNWYYNELINIKAPLSETGALLPGWYLYTKPQ